jgi:4-hydroxy-tetrahydrodipicolinate synthase
MKELPMFSGLSAFPLTPMDEQGIDEAAFVSLVKRLADAGVDSIGALGSTGSYAYLTREERFRVARLAVANAGGVPVIVGIGALRTREVLALSADAQRAGASAVLLAPVSYQKLSSDEVYGLYKAVAHELSVPLCVYDNPGTTGFEFSDELHGRIAELPNVGSIKIPGVPMAAAAEARLARLRALVPANVSIGISGDSYAATGLSAGCDVWYSVIGGLFPQTALAIARAALSGDTQNALQLTERLAPLWNLFYKYRGSLRVIAAAAELLGLVSAPSLPLPLKAIDGADREQLASTIRELALA